MDFIEEYKNMLNNVLTQGDLTTARQLVQSFHTTKQTYDAELCYLEAVLCYYEQLYPLALFWAEMGYQKDASLTPNHELLKLLTTPEQDFSHYEATNTFDCSLMNRRLRIVIFEGVMQIMDYVAEQFRKSFEALGHEVFVFQAKDFANASKEFLQFVSGGIDFALLFNNAGAYLNSTNGKNIWDTLKIPCFDFLFDHPMYYFDSLDEISPYCVVTCVDRKHIDYIRRFYPAVTKSFFLPLGGEETLCPEPIPWEDRSIDALYVGSLKKASCAKSDTFSRIITDYLCTHTDKTTEDAIETCLLYLSDADFFTLFPEFSHIGAVSKIDDVILKKVVETYRFCDTNVNSIYRERLVTELVNAGIDVHVYGDGWTNPALLENPCFHYGGYISQADCLKKMQNTKIVLNSMPWFKDGTHDRVYNAMLCGAVCVTDPSKYLAEQFIDGEDIIYYSLNEMDKLPVLVKDILSNPDKAKQMTETAYQKTVLNHTWQNRAIDLLNRFYQKDFD